MDEALRVELEKIDVLRERMGVGYEEARHALNAADGDVIKALAHLEKEQNRTTEEWRNRGREMWGGLKEKMEDLNQTRISLKRQDKTLFTVSAPLGLALAYTFWRRPGLRLLGLLGAAGAALNHYELEVESPDKSPTAARAQIFTETEIGI